MLLFACHATNETVQLYQLQRKFGGIDLFYKPKGEAGAEGAGEAEKVEIKEISDVKSGAQVVVGKKDEDK